MKGPSKILNSASSTLSLIGMLLLFGLAWKQGPTATEAVALPIFMLAGGVAAARAYKEVKGIKDEKH